VTGLPDGMILKRPTTYAFDDLKDLIECAGSLTFAGELKLIVIVVLFLLVCPIYLGIDSAITV
jgi:hypothetical protein